MSRNNAFSEQEWQTRVNLAALYRMCAKAGMSDLIYTHITARIPGQEDHFLINRFGDLFEHIRASDLVKIDHDGAIVTDDQSPAEKRVNVAGFNIHSAVHMGRPDLNFVIHSHTPAGMAVSAQEEGLLPITQHAMMFYNVMGYHEYESFADKLEERERIRKDLGVYKTMLMRNHGVLVAGASAGEAFFLAHHLERACQAQLLAQAAGAKLTIPPPSVAEQTQRRIAQMRPEAMEFFWQSCLAMIADEKDEYMK